MRQVYLDHNATTPVAAPVLEAMLPYFADRYGNPSSAHALGRAARDAVDTARERVATLLGCRPHDLLFTGGGTEANNAALHAWLAQAPDKRHVVISAVEHASVLEFASARERAGYAITRVPVDGAGCLDPAAVAEAIRPDTACVAVMWANNETGIVHPIPAIADRCHAAGVPLHVDAVQLAGKRPIRMREVPVDSLAVSAHKLYAPKGVGALYLRSRRRFRPLLWGGGQEYGRRAGTENVPGIVGFGAAAALVSAELDREPGRQQTLRDRLEHRLVATDPAITLHGQAADRLANTTSFHIANLEGEAMVREFSEHGIFVSTGAACEAGSGEPSHVMTALGLTKEQAHGSLRVSLGRGTGEAEIEAFCEALPAVLARLRTLLASAPTGATPA